MCSNFEPATIKQIEAIINSQLTLDLKPYKNHVFLKDMCPIIIPSDKGMQVVMGQFGLSPKWASHPVDYATYNARLEGFEGKKTFEPPFNHNQFCLVPMQAFFEPYYRESKNHWQRIYHQDQQAFTIAGMYEYNSHFNYPIHSFTLLTHNAHNEPFMSRFHRPEKEKRSIYLVEVGQRHNYLTADHQRIIDLMSNIEGERFKYEGG